MREGRQSSVQWGRRTFAAATLAVLLGLPLPAAAMGWWSSWSWTWWGPPGCWVNWWCQAWPSPWVWTVPASFDGLSPLPAPRAVGLRPVVIQRAFVGPAPLVVSPRVTIDPPPVAAQPVSFVPAVRQGCEFDFNLVSGVWERVCSP